MSSPPKPPSDAIAPGLGLVVIVWGQLEYTVSLSLAVMLNIHQHPQNDAVLGFIDFREKLEIIKAWGFVHRPNDRWHRRLEKVVNHIDNDLRPRRNRMIHHNWLPGTAGAHTLQDPKPKLKRPQSFKRVLENESIQISPSDMLQLVQDIWEAISALLKVMREFPRSA